MFFLMSRRPPRSTLFPYTTLFRSNPLGYARRFRPLLRPHVGRGLRDCLAACEGADAVLYTPLGFAGFMAAEHLGIPPVGSVVSPLFVRDGGFPSAVLGKPPSLPGSLRSEEHTSEL